MDVLSHVLQESGLVRRLLDLRSLSQQGALRFPCERSMGLHIVTQGQLWIHTPNGAPVSLQAGDVALMARGQVHVVATAPQLDGMTVETVSTRMPVIHGDVSVPAHRASSHVDATLVAPMSASVEVISGAYQLWNAPLHPLFAQLPDWCVLRASERQAFAPLSLAIGMMRNELTQPQMGSRGILDGLLDVVFTYGVRDMLAQHDGTAGLVLAARDAAVFHAVSLLHDDYAQAWTLDSLANRVALSRTSLAERFRRAMGDTPLHYLRTIRMQHAVRLLSETAHTLEHIAAAVGYQDAFGFSKVFKKTVGMSPREFRLHDAEERREPYRFAVPAPRASVR